MEPIVFASILLVVCAELIGPIEHLSSNRNKRVKAIMLYLIANSETLENYILITTRSKISS